MASKKTNGFMVFTKEWKSKQRGELNLQTAVDEAGKIWAKMTPQQRGPYNERAKKDNVVVHKQRELRNCNGIPLSQIDRENKDIKDRELRMQRYIDNVIRGALNNNELHNLPFYFIMFNYFTKTADGSMYIPAEVAVCRYSLEGGQSDVYSTLLNPATEIFGSSYDAMSHATNTHKLPLPPQALGNTDLVEVYYEILRFLRKHDGNEEFAAALPPVYTFNEHMPIVESCLNYLNLLVPDEPKLSVYSVHYLFYKLKRATCEVAGIDPPQSIYITDAQFNRDFFEYQSGIACEYHEEIDRAKYCAQSRVIRWSYTFSDYMCRDLDIELIKERHVPININVNYVVTDSNGNSTWNTSIASSRFKSAASTIGTGNDDDDIKANSSRLGSLSLNNTEPTTDTSSYAVSADVKPWRPNCVMSDTFSADLTGNDFPALSANKKSKKPINKGYVETSTTVLKGSVLNVPKREPTLPDFNMTMSTTRSDLLTDQTNSSFVHGRGHGRGADLSRSIISSDGKNSLRGIDRGFFYEN